MTSDTILAFRGASRGDIVKSNCEISVLIQFSIQIANVKIELVELGLNSNEMFIRLRVKSFMVVYQFECFNSFFIIYISDWILRSSSNELLS